MAREKKQGKNYSTDGFEKNKKINRAERKKQRRKESSEFKKPHSEQTQKVDEILVLETDVTSREDLSQRLNARFNPEDSTVTQEYNTSAIGRSIERIQSLTALATIDQRLGNDMFWQVAMSEIDSSYSLSYIFPEKNDPFHEYSSYLDGQTPSNIEGHDWNDLAFGQNSNPNLPESKNKFTNIPERRDVILPIGFVIDRQSGLFDSLLYRTGCKTQLTFQEAYRIVKA